MNDAVTVSDLAQPTKTYWFRAPVYQAMMVVTFIFVLLGLVVDIRLGLWEGAETVLQPLLGRYLIPATCVVFLGIFLLCFTPFRARLLPLIRSWNYAEILSVVLFLWINSSIACGMKSLINMNIPFYADPYLFYAEKFLHFGVTPTEFLYRWIVSPLVVDAAVFVYSSWFAVGLSFLVMYIWGFPRKYGRERVILSFVLCWLINGTIFAGLFSSVGPIFLSEFFPNFTHHPYQPYVDYMTQQSDFFINAKEALLKMVLVPPFVEVNGISAMPSMHIAICALLYFVVREFWPRWAWCFLVFMIVTLVACLILLTHYAVDGYVAILTSWAIWRWTARYDR